MAKTQKNTEGPRRLRERLQRWIEKTRTRPLYRVRDWSQHFENAEMRKYGRLYSVNVPNKHDGKGFARLCVRPDSIALFGAFILTLQLASKAPLRGWLCDEDGPWGAEELAEQCRMTGQEPIFQRVLDELCTERIDWLERVPVEELQTSLDAFLAGAPEEDAPEETGRPPEGAGKRLKSSQYGASTGRQPEMPGISPSITPIPGKSPSHEPIPGDGGRPPETTGDSGRLPGSDRIGSDRNVPPIAPQGGQSVEADASHFATAAASAEKKEGGGGQPDGGALVLGSMEAYHATYRRICQIGGRSSGKLSARAENGLRDAMPSLPLSEMQWIALERMIAARRSSGGQPEDLRLKLRELESADLLAANLLETADRAVAWLRDQVGGISAGAGTEKKERGAEPEGWRDWLAKHYPQAGGVASYWELPEDMRQEFEGRAA